MARYREMLTHAKEELWAQYRLTSAKLAVVGACLENKVLPLPSYYAIPYCLAITEFGPPVGTVPHTDTYGGQCTAPTTLKIVWYTSLFVLHHRIP